MPYTIAGRGSGTKTTWHKDQSCPITWNVKRLKWRNRAVVDAMRLKPCRVCCQGVA